jgi:hypothetical protein
MNFRGFCARGSASTLMLGCAAAAMCAAANFAHANPDHPEQVLPAPEIRVLPPAQWAKGIVGKYGMPKLASGQLWVSSIPVGMKVYVAPVSVDPQFGEKTDSRALRFVTGTHPLVTAKYRRGSTPFVVENLSPSEWYFVGVEQDLASRDPSLRTELVVFPDQPGKSMDWLIKVVRGQVHQRGTAVYAIRMPGEGGESLIVSTVRAADPGVD